MTKPDKQPEPQLRRFIETARELGCDESEEAFAETLKRVGRQRPPDEQQQKGSKTKRKKAGG